MLDVDHLRGKVGKRKGQVITQAISVYHAVNLYQYMTNDR